MTVISSCPRIATTYRVRAERSRMIGKTPLQFGYHDEQQGVHLDGSNSMPFRSFWRVTGGNVHESSGEELKGMKATGGLHRPF